MSTPNVWGTNNMKIQIFSIAMLLSISVATAASATWHHRILDVKTLSELTFEDLSIRAAVSQTIAIGELHNTTEVQILEARIIEEVVTRLHLKGRFSLGWEFLAVTQKVQNKLLYSDFMSGKITALEFLTATVGKSTAPFYVPVLETLKKFEGDLKGINLTREEKAPVTKGGIKSADPQLIPPGFEMGGANYWERFTKAMGEHVPAEKHQNYFEAQCLTDDVMAYSLENEISTVPRFFIAGNFHTDFFDGTISRLKKRNPTSGVLSIRIIDTSEYKESELLGLLNHYIYGPISDLVIFVNEPVQQKQK